MIRAKRFFFFILFSLLSCETISALSLKPKGTFPHQETAYTQGLFFHLGYLYESIGLYGQSEFRKLDAETGKVLQKYTFPKHFFAEGACVHEGFLYVLTWNEQTCFIFDPRTLKPVAQLSYAGEGWGLCSDGKHLIMSDGSATLTFRNPQNMQVVRSIHVRYKGKLVEQLNELEYVNGEIWANVYMTDWIVRIHPQTGIVMDKMDFSRRIAPALRGDRAEVMNGIAWNSKTDEIMIGGKLWKNFFRYTLIR